MGGNIRITDHGLLCDENEKKLITTEPSSYSISIVTSFPKINIIINQ
jgi:hypothetical protein